MAQALGLGHQHVLVAGEALRRLRGEGGGQEAHVGVVDVTRQPRRVGGGHVA
jgi:hypothetical protein